MEAASTPGQRLKLMRTTLKMTLADLGNAIGKTAAAVHRYETDQRRINPTVVVALHSKLNLNPEWLLTGNGDMFFQDKLEVETYAIPIYDINQGYEAFTEGKSITGRYNVSPDVAGAGFSNPEFINLVKCPDNTMSPLLMKGDLIGIDKSDTKERDAGIYLCRVKDTLLLREVIFRRPYIILIAKNSSSTAAEYDDFAILGRVNWLSRVIE